MLAAHMDEIGLMVTHIDDRGYLRFVPLGGWDARTLVGQRVMVHGREDLPGIVGTTPVHLLDEAARQKAPAARGPGRRYRPAGRRASGALVRQGDVITRTRTLEDLGELVTGKSLDDRVGLFVMIEALRAAAAVAAPRSTPTATAAGGGRPARRQGRRHPRRARTSPSRSTRAPPTTAPARPQTARPPAWATAPRSA